jgi:sodium/potassium-transporting ATPase subunit alpha
VSTSYDPVIVSWMCESDNIALLRTGESKPLPGTVENTDPNYLETRCIGMQGTHCIYGSGTGVVVSTGNKTVFGRIAKMTNEPKTGLTTLEREVLNFVIAICSIMFTMIVVVIIVWCVEP